MFLPPPSYAFGLLVFSFAGWELRLHWNCLGHYLVVGQTVLATTTVCPVVLTMVAKVIRILLF